MSKVERPAQVPQRATSDPSGPSNPPPTQPSLAPTGYHRLSFPFSTQGLSEHRRPRASLEASSEDGQTHLSRQAKCLLAKVEVSRAPRETGAREGRLLVTQAGPPRTAVRGPAHAGMQAAAGTRAALGAPSLARRAARCSSAGKPRWGPTHLGREAARLPSQR